MSTLVGVPVTWGLLFVVEIVTAGAVKHGFATPYARFQSIVLQAPWLLPYERNFDWLVPTATLVLLPFYFVVSALVERAVLVRALPSESRRRVSVATWLANVASYGILLAASAAWLWSSPMRH